MRTQQTQKNPKPSNRWRVTGAGQTITTNSMAATLVFLNAALRANDPAEPFTRRAV